MSAAALMAILTVSIVVDLDRAAVNVVDPDTAANGPTIIDTRESIADADDSHGRSRLISHTGLNLHKGRPYYRQLVRLLLQTPPPSSEEDTWIDTCERIHSHLLDADPDYARDVYEPCVRWYRGQYPVLALERVFDLLEFYFREYDQRDDPDPDRWPEPNQFEVITTRVFNSYVKARGLEITPVDNDDDDSDDDDDDNGLDLNGGAPNPFSSLFDLESMVDDVDDDRDEFFSVLSELPNLSNVMEPETVMPVKSNLLRDVDNPFMSARYSYPGAGPATPKVCLCKGNASDYQPTMVDIMVADLGRFPSESVLKHRWWTDLGMASAIIGLVVLAVVMVVLSDTQAFHVKLQMEPHKLPVRPREWDADSGSGRRQNSQQLVV